MVWDLVFSPSLLNPVSSVLKILSNTSLCVGEIKRVKELRAVRTLSTVKSLPMLSQVENMSL